MQQILLGLSLAVGGFGAAVWAAHDINTRSPLVHFENADAWQRQGPAPSDLMPRITLDSAWVHMGVSENCRRLKQRKT